MKKPRETYQSNRQTQHKKEVGIVAFMLAAVAMLIIPEGAWAFATPVAGSFGYEVYDVGVNMILKGPIGFMAGVLFIVYGGFQVLKSWMMGIGAILIGALIVRADAMVTTLGALVV